MKDRLKHDRLIIAHRGHKVGAPEQTLSAFCLAADLGAKMLEADLRFTSDGIPVLMHDANVVRTTSGQGPISELSWAEVGALDAGSWFSRRFAGERVPRLEQLFQLAERRGIALCLEAKGETPPEMQHAVLFAAHEVARRNRLGVDVVASFDHRALAAAVEAVPGLRTAPDRLPERGPSTAADLIAQAKTARASIIQHHFVDLTAPLVAEVQAAGIQVWAWAPANLEEARFAAATGAQGLMGDDVTAISTAAGEP